MENVIRTILSIFLVLGVTVSITVPLIKDGPCPTGYSSSYGYCIPSPNAFPAIEKRGSCPIGYRTCGNYCIANNMDSKVVIIRHGNCPMGFHSYGQYCVEN